MEKGLPYKSKFIVTQVFLNPNDRYASGYHLGIDLVGLEDKTIYAVRDGKIIYVGYDSGYGNSVVVQQNDGFYCRYSHLESIRVDNNQYVTGGKTVVGAEGSTGNVSGGNDPRHLDLKISRKPYHTDNIDD